MASLTKARNSLTRFVPISQFVIGIVTGDPVTPTVTKLGGDLIADNACVSISRTATGVYALKITNFQGTRGATIIFTQQQVVGDSIGAVVAPFTPGSDTMTVTFIVRNSGGAAVDDSFYFCAFAY